MITGKLAKFEPTESGITVTIKCTDDQMGEVVSLYKKDVSVDTVQTSIPETPDAALLIAIENILTGALERVQGYKKGE